MATAPRAAGSARTAQGNQLPRDRIAEALYAWCSANQDVGHIFNQENLLDSGVIPNRDMALLLSAVQHLVAKSLFRTHDIRGTGSIGWELVSQERAENYLGLTREEHLVFSHIDAAGNQGLWTKTLQKRMQAHVKVLDRTYKSLEQKGRIKSMKSVKHPTRKMYIVAGLQPSEDATGGAWFHQGGLDEGLIAGVTLWAEKYVSDRSWVAVRPPTTADDHEPATYNDAKGKGKSNSAAIDDDEPRSLSPELTHRDLKSKRKRPPTEYVPHPPGYTGYATVADIANELNAKNVANGTRLPTTAIAQLMEVMVYDEKLYKLQRERRSNEPEIETDKGMVTMFRCFRNPAQLERDFRRTERLRSAHAVERKAARRQVELEDVGRGGASEVPCLKCPAFDLCGDGGPVNVVTCPYFDEWYLRIARADRDEGTPWSGSDEFLKTGERKKQQRLDALNRPPIKIEPKPEAMDVS